MYTRKLFLSIHSYAQCKYERYVYFLLRDFTYIMYKLRPCNELQNTKTRKIRFLNISNIALLIECLYTK